MQSLEELRSQFEAADARAQLLAEAALKADTKTKETKQIVYRFKPPKPEPWFVPKPEPWSQGDTDWVLWVFITSVIVAGFMIYASMHP